MKLFASFACSILLVVALSVEIAESDNMAFKTAKKLVNHQFTLPVDNFAGIIKRDPESIGDDKAKVFISITAISAAKDYDRKGMKNAEAFVTIEKMYRKPVIEAVQTRGASGITGSDYTEGIPIEAERLLVRDAVAKLADAEFGKLSKRGTALATAQALEKAREKKPFLIKEGDAFDGKILSVESIADDMASVKLQVDKMKSNGKALKSGGSVDLKHDGSKGERAVVVNQVNYVDEAVGDTIAKAANAAVA